jgi:hypothetical protein
VSATRPGHERRSIATLVWTAALCAGLVASIGAVEAQTPADLAVSTLACEPEVPRQVAILVGDVDDEFVPVARDLVAQLSGTPPVEAMVATARPEFEVLASWQAPEGGGATSLADAISRAALVADEQPEEPPAPFAVAEAVAGVASEFEARAIQLGDDGPEPCRLVLVLTSEVSLGEDSVCDLVTGALAPAGARALVGASTVDGAEEGDEGRSTCGAGGLVVQLATAADLAAELAVVAALVRGAGVAERPLAVCPEGACDDERWTFTLDPVLGRFTATITVPTAESTVVVGLPWGVGVPIQDRSSGPIAAGSFLVEPTWVTPTVLRLDARLDPGEDDWPGDWQLTVVDPDGVDEGASVVVAAESGVVPRFANPPRLVAGRPVTVVVELADRSDRYVPADAAASVLSVQVSAIDADGSTIGEALLEPDSFGGFEGQISVPDDLAEDGALQLVATVRHTTNLVSLADVETRNPARLLAADAWPRITSDRAVMAGDRGAVARGAITVAAGPEIEACVWLEQGVVTLGGAPADIQLGGGARSAASCVIVPAGTTQALGISVDLSDELDIGRYEGAVLVGIGSTAEDSFDEIEVAVVIDVARPIDVPRRLLITALLSILGLGLPVAAVWLLDVVKARFRPSRTSVMAEVPIAVWSDGTFHRADTGSVLLVSNDMFEPAELGRGRRLSVAGLDLAVRNARSPLRPPLGTVSSPSGPVVASEGVLVDDLTVLGRVPLNLRDTWIFELDVDRTRRAALDATASDFQAAHGRLVLIRASMESDPIRFARLPRLAKELARQARSAGGEDNATTQEMLDFVEVNVSAPRDLPRAVTPALGEGAPRSSQGDNGPYEFVGFEDAITFDDFDDFDDEEVDESDDDDRVDEVDDDGGIEGDDHDDDEDDGVDELDDDESDEPERG